MFGDLNWLSISSRPDITTTAIVSLRVAIPISLNQLILIQPCMSSGILLQSYPWVYITHLTALNPSIHSYIFLLMKILLSRHIVMLIADQWMLQTPNEMTYLMIFQKWKFYLNEMLRFCNEDKMCDSPNIPTICGPSSTIFKSFKDATIQHLGYYHERK